MKVTGVLGGMSWESSLDSYRRANEQVRDRFGGYHWAQILLDSPVPVFPTTALHVKAALATAEGA